MPGTVPEKPTWTLMLLGFAGLAFAGYRRAKAGHAGLAATDPSLRNLLRWLRAVNAFVGGSIRHDHNDLDRRHRNTLTQRTISQWRKTGVELGTLMRVTRRHGRPISLTNDVGPIQLRIFAPVWGSTSSTGRISPPRSGPRQALQGPRGQE